MRRVIYSAILIDKADRERILKDAVHLNLYGDHVTLHFYGNDGPVDTPYAGERVDVRLINHYSDEQGDAWDVKCSNAHVEEIKESGQYLHVTVSCADGTKPVYSNELIVNEEPDGKEGYVVHGRIAYYMTDHQWHVD